jgi:Fe-S cluster biosynthesis and repair protein YggX
MSSCGEPPKPPNAPPPPGARMVHCVKYGKDLPGMPFRPFDDELGQRIYDSVSMDAWRLWLEHSKMIINEYRLDLVSPQAQQILRQQMEQFFFGEGAQLPPGFVPQQK